MLIIDDILLFPAKGIFWVFQKIQNAAEQEVKSEAENLTARLSDLYMMLETGQITEEDFNTQEKEILDRLDQIK